MKIYKYKNAEEYIKAQEEGVYNHPRVPDAVNYKWVQYSDIEFIGILMKEKALQLVMKVIIIIMVQSMELYGQVMFLKWDVKIHMHIIMMIVSI